MQWQQYPTFDYSGQKACERTKNRQYQRLVCVLQAGARMAHCMYCHVILWPGGRTNAAAFPCLGGGCHKDVTDGGHGRIHLHFALVATEDGCGPSICKGLHSQRAVGVSGYLQVPRNSGTGSLKPGGSHRQCVAAALCRTIHKRNSM
jgi:hypothetical protein